jgi:phosphoglycerol transferase MdoB-like AlkP superfamily enzyme
MESMSARFLASYGGSPELTPNLDRIASDGLWFSNVFATGTRTVRGIEAVMLSLPPTPGQSIVRRPGGEGLYNLGTEFQKRGYDSSFIYGGRGFFDNMGPFFESSGFRVVDRSAFEGTEATFSTAWGLCDEDLFRKSVQEADRSTAAGKPFFQFLLTTSNHRPYRYPEGKVAIPSGAVREGAIQYSDFAIGEFLREARKHPWFDDTVFVFVADHNASVAGGSGVVPRDYLIPLVFYSPSHLKPHRVSELGSQMDLGPTLFDLFGWEFDQQRFFGSSLVSAPSREAYFGTYQEIGRMAEGSFVLLEPRQRVRRYSVNTDLTLGPPRALSDAEVEKERDEAISDYELAAQLYSSGGLALRKARSGTR